MSTETRIDIPRPSRSFRIRALRIEEDRLRHEARVALFRCHYQRARILAGMADDVRRDIELLEHRHA